MRSQLIVCFCLSEIAGILSKSARIVGGENADIKDFPYSVSLKALNTNHIFCGGAIISNWHVITAGHCVKERTHSLIRIYMGSSTLQTSSEEAYGIMTIAMHPKYVGDSNSRSAARNDIAVILLDRYIQFNEFKNKINLPTEDVTTESNGVVSGWGVTDVTANKLAETLQKASMRIITFSECQKVLPKSVKEEHVCGFQRIGVGTCFGDSGSPLVRNGELVGISSFVRPCGTGIPDVYTSVYFHLEFIRTVLTISKLIPCTNT